MILVSFFTDHRIRLQEKKYQFEAREAGTVVAGVLFFSCFRGAFQEKVQKLNEIKGYLVEGEMLCPAIKDKLKTLISSQILAQGH